MRRLSTVALLLALLSNGLRAQTIWRSEMLGKPTDTGITLKLFFADSAEVRVSYGTTSGTYTAQTPWQAYADSMPVEITLNGLLPDTRYYYRVRYRQPGTTTINSRPEYTFHTQRAPGSPFVYVVQADPHLDASSDTALYRLCLQNQLEDNPDFMVDLGDFLMSDKLKSATTNSVPYDTIPYRCNLLRSFYETGCHSVPLYIAIGNHEGESGWNLNGTANNVAIWNTNERKKYFLNPVPDGFYTGDTTNQPFTGQRGNYYAWTWGDAQFIVLDPYWYTSVKPDSLHGWRWTLGATQYEWLKNTLESSTSAYRFVFAHHLIGGDAQGRGGTEFADFYEWGGNNIDSTPGFAVNRPGWAKPVKDLLTDNRVNIFFHGHDHFFAKQSKDCLIYQELPQPSLPNFNYPNSAAPYGYLQGLIIGNSGHMRVTVDSAGTTVEYVRVYLPSDTSATRHNKDVSATYYISRLNCYDSLMTGSPVIWNTNYAEDISYPNPFSQQTSIVFSLDKPQRIELDVYDIHGKFVRRLLAGNRVAEGRFAVIWDGKDGYENDVADGTYVYSLRGESIRSSGKMILKR